MRSFLAFTFAFASAAYAQDWVAGVEANDAASFSYVTHYSRQPLSRTTQLVYFETISYLTYRINENGGTTRINSPGIGGGVMYRWEQRQLSAGVGAGYEMRWTERRPPGGLVTRETQAGPTINGDVGRRFGRTSARAGVAYSSANEWRAASGDIRQDIGHRLRIGPQVVWQGNEDIKVLSAGAVLEIPLGPNAIQLRGGRARIRERNGTSETRPYFSVGVAHSF